VTYSDRRALFIAYQELQLVSVKDYSVKGCVRSSSWKSISKLCCMGPHSVAGKRAPLEYKRSKPHRPTPVLDSSTPEWCKAELTWGVFPRASTIFRLLQNSLQYVTN